GATPGATRARAARSWPLRHRVRPPPRTRSSRDRRPRTSAEGGRGDGATLRPHAGTPRRSPDGSPSSAPPSHRAPRRGRRPAVPDSDSGSARRLDGHTPGRYSRRGTMIPEGETTVRSGAETLEARVAVPPGARAGVVVCPPHPLYGGDMDNPVVERIVEACSARGLATLRFNFRGVGGSSGRHDQGRGEQEDVRASVSHLQNVLGRGTRVALAGYSFGAAMVAAVATSTTLAGLALVAPPMRVADLKRPTGVTGPIVVVAGAEDQYCPASALEALRVLMPDATVVVIEGADHFFFGSLVALGDAGGAWG